MKSNLEKQFLDFLSHMPGFLPVDGQHGVATLKHVKGLQICDHFSNNPELSIPLTFYERKRLNVVKTFTSQELAFARCLNRDVAAGAGKVDDLLSAFRPKLLEKLANRLDDVVCKANGQIRDTGFRMNLPLHSYNGILLILNDAVEMLGHEVLLHICQVALTKREVDGRVRYPHINGVVVFDETQRVVGSNREPSPTAPLCYVNGTTQIGSDMKLRDSGRTLHRGTRFRPLIGARFSFASGVLSTISRHL